MLQPEPSIMTGAVGEDWMKPTILLRHRRICWFTNSVCSACRFCCKRAMKALIAIPTVMVAINAARRVSTSVNARHAERRERLDASNERNGNGVGSSGIDPGNRDVEDGSSSR